MHTISHFCFLNTHTAYFCAHRGLSCLELGRAASNLTQPLTRAVLSPVSRAWHQRVSTRTAGPSPLEGRCSKCSRREQGGGLQPEHAEILTLVPALQTCSCHGAPACHVIKHVSQEAETTKRQGPGCIFLIESRHRGLRSPSGRTQKPLPSCVPRVHPGTVCLPTHLGTTLKLEGDGVPGICGI